MLGAGLGFSALVKDGIDFNRTLEDTNLGIASVLGTLQKYTDANGQALSGTQKFTAAQADATRVQEQLKNAALTTTASYTEMVEAYQVGIGPMLRGKIAMSDTVEATKRLTQAAGALGIPMAQLGIETRQFFEGDYARSRLLQGLGITGEEVRRLSASGGLMDMLREKTESIGVAGELATQTFTGLVSNVKDFISQAMGQGVEELYTQIKGVLGEVSNMFGHIEGEAFVFNEGLIDSLTAIGNGLAGVFSMAWETVKGFFERITEGLTSKGLTWGDVFRSVGIVAVEAFGIIEKGALYLATSIAHPFDTALGHIATVFSGLLAYASEAAEKMSKIPLIGTGMSELANQLNRASVAMSNTEPVKKYSSAMEDINTKVDAQTKGWKSLIGALDATGDADSNLHHELATNGEVVKGLTADQKKLTESFEDFARKQLAGLSTAGLDGYAKALADVRKKHDESTIALDIWIRKLANGNVANAALVKTLRDAYDQAEKYNLGKAQEDALKKYTAAGDSMLAFTKTNAEQRLAIEEQTKLSQIAKFFEVQIENARNLDEIVAAFDRKHVAIRAVQKLTADQQKMLLGSSTGDWALYMQGAMAAVTAGTKTIRDVWGQTADEIIKKGTTISEGFLAGLLEIKAKAPGITRSTADLVGGIWQAQGQLFTNVFTNVLTGDFQGLKGTVEGFGKSIAGIFAKYFGDILQNWLLTKLGIEQNAITGRMTTTQGGDFGGDVTGGVLGSVGSGGVGGAVAGGVMGYGLGSAVGGTSGAPGFSTGAAIGGAVGGILASTILATVMTSVATSLGAGAAAGSVAGPLGAIIGAIIGGLIGVLLAPNSEKHAPIVGSHVGYRGPWKDDPVGANLLATRDMLTGGFLSLFKASGGEDGASFGKSLNKAINGYLQGIQFEAHAGSTEDLQKNMERILTEIVPREALHVLFGGNRTGGQDLAGISGA